MICHQLRQVYQNRFKKWNKKIWIAKKVGSIEDDFGYEIPLYTKPKIYEINVQPVSASADMQEFGERAKQMQRAVIELKKYFGKFKEFDVAYLDEATPLNNGEEFIVNREDINDSAVDILNELEIVNVATDEVKCYMCPDANYKLYPPRNQNKCITLYFERIIGK